MIADEQGDIVERLETKKSTEKKIKEPRGMGGGGGWGRERVFRSEGVGDEVKRTSSLAVRLIAGCGHHVDKPACLFART